MANSVTIKEISLIVNLSDEQSIGVCGGADLSADTGRYPKHRQNSRQIKKTVFGFQDRGTPFWHDYWN